MKTICLIPLVITLFIQPLFAQTKSLSENLEQHVEVLASDSLEGRGIGNSTLPLVREYIIENFKEGGLKPYQGSFEHEFSFKVNLARVKGVNLVGILEGVDPVLKKEYIVVGAHYDHLGYKITNGQKVIYNGADDNASGTAGIIEIAKFLSGQEIPLKRSIIFVAFDAEEIGLVGSRRILMDSVLISDNIRLMFSLDMIGMYEANKGLNLKGLLSLANGSDLLETTLKKKNISVKKVNAVIEQRTDTKHFGERGIPAVHFFTGTNSPYHKPEDDSDLLDYEGMAEIVEFASILTTNAANAETLEPNNKLKRQSNMPVKEGKTFTLGLRANLGSSFHNYTDEYFKAKTVVAAQMGLFSRIKLSSLLSIQPELLYQTEGSQSAAGNLRTHAFSVPVNLVLGTPDRGYVRFYTFTGGYYTYRFNGKIGSEDLTFDKDLKQVGYGLNFGFGTEVGDIHIGYVYKHGLTNLNDSGEGSDLNERAHYFMMGFNF
jgi:aminopeptidase YwaD